MADVIRYNLTSDFRFNDLTLYGSTWRSESPQPNTENKGYHQRDPTQAHWDRERSDGDLGFRDQPQQMTQRENPEDNARNVQSSSW
jgi:hypothetical protein